MKLVIIAIGLLWIGMSTAVTAAQSGSPPQVVQGTLTEPGATPFYLQAAITERRDPDEHIDVEMSWVAPDKWRRTIQSKEFSQTLIVNGDKVFEQDSENYFPLGIQTLVTAMVDPKPVLAAVRPGDQVMTSERRFRRVRQNVLRTQFQDVWDQPIWVNRNCPRRGTLHRFYGLPEVQRQENSPDADLPHRSRRQSAGAHWHPGRTQEPRRGTVCHR
jgi:hypothetical protein